MTLSLDHFASFSGARRYEGYIMLACPFHDDHKPSLMVFPDRKFKCLACGEWGNWEKLDAKLTGSFHPSVPAPAKATPSLQSYDEDAAAEAHLSLISHPGLGHYLEQRGVASLIKSCMLGWVEGWYTVPSFDFETGDYVGMALRASPAVEKVTGLRHFIPPKQLPTLYAPSHLFIREAERVYVVFGIFDALVMAAAGYPVVTVIAGHRAYSPRLFDRIRKSIIVVPDRGEKVQLHTQLGWRGVLHQVDWPPFCKDPADLVANGYKLERYIP